MKNLKYWALVVLFALFVNLLHEFTTFHDQNSHTMIKSHVVESIHDIKDSEICGYCSCFHLNFTLNEFEPIIFQLDLLRVQFNQIDVITLYNKLKLLKPPIA